MDEDTQDKTVGQVFRDVLKKYMEEIVCCFLLILAILAALGIWMLAGYLKSIR